MVRRLGACSHPRILISGAGRKAKSEVDQDGDGEEGATAKKVKKELSEEGSDLDA